MAEALLATLKAALLDPKLPQPNTFEIYDVEQMLSRLRRIDDEELVTEYRQWLEHRPGLTAAMTCAVKELERTEELALLAFIRLSEPGVEAA
jgi:hypothetical protein